MGMHIVAVGNPIDGLRFYGPFATSDEAIEWAEKNFAHTEWWVAPLEAQEG